MSGHTAIFFCLLLRRLLSLFSSALFSSPLLFSSIVSASSSAAAAASHSGLLVFRPGGSSDHSPGLQSRSRIPGQVRRRVCALEDREAGFGWPQRGERVERAAGEGRRIWPPGLVGLVDQLRGERGPNPVLDLNLNLNVTSFSLLLSPPSIPGAPNVRRPLEHETRG